MFNFLNLNFRHNEQNRTVVFMQIAHIFTRVNSIFTPVDNKLAYFKKGERNVYGT